MSRERLVIRNGKFVPIEKAGPPPQAGRILGAGPGVISDDLGQPLEHMGYADGRRTDSKSVFRRWTKNAGLIEKGNDRERPERAKPQDLRQDVALALQMCKNGYKPALNSQGFGGDGWQ